MANFIFTVSLFLLSFCFSPLKSQGLKMYVCDAGNFQLPPWQILKFDADGSNGEVFIADHLAWPQDIFFMEEENTVLISNFLSGEIVRFDASTGAYKNVFAKAIGGPTRMKVGPGGYLYVLQWSGNGRVKRYALDGTFIDDFTDVGVPKSIGLDWDEENNLYVSSYDGFVRKFSSTGQDMGKFINSNLAGPTNIWFDEDENLFVMDYNGALVKKFTSSGSFVENFISGVSQCEGVDFMPNGNILLGVGSSASVRMYTPEGGFIKTVVPTGALGLLQPNAVVLHEEGTTGVFSEQVAYKEMNIVNPSIGTQFEIVISEKLKPGTQLLFNDASGHLAMRVNLMDSLSIDASNLPDGIYVITLPLKDSIVARQKVIIQH